MFCYVLFIYERHCLPRMYSENIGKRRQETAWKTFYPVLGGHLRRLSASELLKLHQSLRNTVGSSQRRLALWHWWSHSARKIWRGPRANFPSAYESCSFIMVHPIFVRTSLSLSRSLPTLEGSICVIIGTDESFLHKSLWTESGDAGLLDTLCKTGRPFVNWIKASFLNGRHLENNGTSSRGDALTRFGCKTRDQVFLAPPCSRAMGHRFVHQFFSIGGISLYSAWIHCGNIYIYI